MGRTFLFPLPQVTPALSPSAPLITPVNIPPATTSSWTPGWWLRYGETGSASVPKYAIGQGSNALVEQSDCYLARETLRIPTNTVERLRGRSDGIDESGRLAKPGRGYIKISTLPSLIIGWDYFV